MPKTARVAASCCKLEEQRVDSAFRRDVVGALESLFAKQMAEDAEAAARQRVTWLDNDSDEAKEIAAGDGGELEEGQVDDDGSIARFQAAGYQWLPSWRLYYHERSGSYYDPYKGRYGISGVWYRWDTASNSYIRDTSHEGDTCAAQTEEPEATVARCARSPASPAADSTPSPNAAKLCSSSNGETGVHSSAEDKKEKPPRDPVKDAGHDIGQWAVVDEHGRSCLAGLVDGKPRKTTPIVRVTGCTVETASGSRYTLRDPDSNFMSALHGAGVRVDPANPLEKFGFPEIRGEPTDHERNTPAHTVVLEGEFIPNDAHPNAERQRVESRQMHLRRLRRELRRAEPVPTTARDRARERRLRESKLRNANAEREQEIEEREIRGMERDRERARLVQHNLPDGRFGLGFQGN